MMLDPFSSLGGPHPLDALAEETEQFQRREKIPTFLKGAELLRLLQTGRAWEGRELAEKVGVDRRTLRRYIAHLRDLGFSIESKPGAAGSYMMSSGDVVPPLTLTDDELEVLILALSSTGYPGDELGERAGRLRQRIGRLLPPLMNQQLADAGMRRYYDVVKFWGAYNREQKAQQDGTGN